MNETRLRFLAPLLAFTLSWPAAAQRAPEPTARTSDAGARRIDAREAVRTALRQNPARSAADLDVEQAKQKVLSEEGRYPYIFQADAGYTRSRIPRLQADDSVTSSTTRSYTVGTALRRTFPTGTSAEIRVEGERFENDGGGSGAFGGASTGADSGYNAIGRASLTQPLLRGFGTRVGEAELRAARASRSAAEKTKTRISSELVRDVLVGYYELWYAGEAISIEQAALDLAREQEKQAQARTTAGAASKADELSFSTRVAQLEESVVGAELQQQQRSLELSRLMGTTGNDAERLVAASPPPPKGPSATRADVEAALRAGSVELAELESQVKLQRVRAEVAGDASRARLDLEGFLESQGTSERVPRAFERAGQMRWLTVHAGLIFELPLDDTRRRADRASASLAVRIAETNLRQARDRIGSEATLATANESAAERRLALAEKTLELALKTHEAEKGRYELGTSIPIQVQQAEDEVRRARLRVARARVDLAKAQVDVLHLSGKLSALYGAG